MSNAALAAYRKARAVELALAGSSYDEIAHELGLANRGTAWHLVQNALKERLFAAVDGYRQAELTRLQRLEDALWPKAMAGNYRAGNAVLNVMGKRIRLLGLDQVATREGNRCTCECPIHGSQGSWRPTRRAQDMAERFDPPAALVADVEERMVTWAEAIGVWALFGVMTIIAQVMEAVRDAEAVETGEAPA